MNITRNPLRVFLLGSLCLCLASASANDPRATPIKFAVNEWTGQHVSTHIAGATLKRAGYTVQFVTAGAEPQLNALRDGTLHVTMEVWSSNTSPAWKQLARSGEIEDIGETGLSAREGLLYPVHVKTLCPGLPAWRALRACAALFASAETQPFGRLLDYPAEWGTPGADRIKALELPFKAVPAGSEGALVAELKAAVARKSPLFMVFWQPHWALSAYETEWVELPEAEPACFSDPGWGPNPQAINDCDFAPSRVYKVVSGNFHTQWPRAYKILKAVTIDTHVQQQIVAAVDQRGAELNAEIQRWMHANRKTIDSWIQSAGKSR